VWLAAHCPLCMNVVVEVLDIAGSEVRGRCRNRRCRDKPRVRWQVTNVLTVVVISLDVDRAPALGQRSPNRENVGVRA